MYLFSNEAFINEPVIHLLIIFKQCHLNALYWYHFSCSDVYIDPRNVGFASFRIFIRRLTVCELIITAGLWTHRYVTRKKNMMKQQFCLICILYKIVPFRETRPRFIAFSFSTHGAINTTDSGFSRTSILKSQSIKKCELPKPSCLYMKHGRIRMHTNKLNVI